MNTPIFKTRQLDEAPLRVDIYDTDGETFYGAVWVKFRDPSSAAYQSLLKRRFDNLPKNEQTRLSKPRSDKDKRDSAQWSVEFFVDEYVTDSALESADGKGPLKHDKATVVQFFMAMEFAFDQCVAQAGNYANFKKGAEEDAKNA